MKNTENEYYSFIKEQISIKDILDKLGIATKNSGDDFICSCIYHNDPNPSMHIYSATNTFYCFECKRGGNGFTIIKEKLNCDFHKSIQWLENAYPWLLEEKPIVKNQSLLKPVRNAFQIAYEVYKKMDYKEEAGLLAFAKNREYEAEFLSNRDIFFAFGKKLHSVYVEHEEQYVEEMELLKEASLLRPLPRRRNDIKTHYEDFCRDDRIIFTLRDERSEIVGFAGRSLKEKTSYKYLFTKKLPKSKILYRFDDVLKQVAKDKDNNTIYIVEGMFDALRLEEKGYLAVAVMGSQLTEKQVRLLKMAASRARTRLSFNIFLDSDEAGLKGAVASIRRIWKCEALCGYNVWVSVLKEYKDPDEAFQDGRKEMAIRYTAFEFLMRYHMADIGKYIVGQEVKERILSIDLQEEFKEIGIDARFGLYAGIEDLLTEKEWNTVFEKYNAVFGATEKENKSNEEFAYVKLREFIIGKNEDKNSGYSAEKRKQTEEREKDYQYRMQIALQIARTGYAREEISLDDSTWDRIALSADIVYGYFYRILQEQKSIDIPMITMQLPKKLGEQRTKSLYCHEELILQQYVMNELLSRGSDENFEKCIPAVRYEEQRGIYLTGYGMEGVEEPVSFAYQIDMSVINGEAEIKNGMFRPFQDKMLQDMQNFGTYTALYQRESRYLRTPILLVPACTTRAVDYYVFGQGFYLSAGLKTVFCNGVGTGGRGGSCFIGQDSWDDKKIHINEYLMPNTIYHGLKPGIYRQTSEYRGRGALGEKEQALLICDVYPDMEKGKPNAESMLDALSIVAHIPIFEEKILGEECEKCKKFVLEGLNERREKTIKELIQIKKYCEDHSGNGREIGIEKYLLTYDDNKDSMNEVLKAMTDLGKHYHSEWFVRRAEYYEKFYKMYPQAWPPQTFTDWLYVEVDYSEFLENKIGYRIEMPERE